MVTGCVDGSSQDRADGGTRTPYTGDVLRFRLHWTSLRLLFAAVAITLLSSTTAQADVRRLTINDPVDPGLAFDLAQINVAFDRERGTIGVIVRLHRPAPDGGSYADRYKDSVTISIRQPDAADRETCREIVGPYDSQKGDTIVSVSWADASFFGQPGGFVGYQTSSSTAFRQESTEEPTRFHPDRMGFTVEVSDPLLLQGTDLRCVSASSAGRVAYDPTRPEGGESYDGVQTRMFAGYPPVAFSAKPRRSRLQPPGKLGNLPVVVSCNIVCKYAEVGVPFIFRGGQEKTFLRYKLENRRSRLDADMPETYTWRFSTARTAALARLLKKYGELRWRFVYFVEGASGSKTTAVVETRMLPPRPATQRPTK